ncbi:MAG: anthranilate phosphoribosyltransferase, partial [Oceanicaulis sp.]
LAVDPDDVAGDSADLTEEILAGDRGDHFADAVALNAAFRIYARDDADTLEEGLELARESIDSGAAEAVLEELRAF